MKRTTIIAVAVLLVGLFGLYRAGYHGPRNFSAENGALPDSKQVAENARRLVGTPYDPLMGRYGNIGAKFGFIVCSDVPNIAYGLSGFSLKRMLEEDYRKTPSAYGESSSGNKPGNPFFHRRARNLYAYFKNNNRLFSSTSGPSVGDLAFYKLKSHEYVAHVALVTEVSAANYMLVESTPDTLFAREVPGPSIIKRGEILVGLGRMYPASTKRPGPARLEH